MACVGVGERGEQPALAHRVTGAGGDLRRRATAQHEVTIAPAHGEQGVGDSRALAHALQEEGRIALHMSGQPRLQRVAVDQGVLLCHIDRY